METQAKERPNKGANVLVLTYPVQGHINPMLQFSKRLASKGLKVTVITTSSISHQLSSSHTNSSSSLDFVEIFDGVKDVEKTDIDGYLHRLEVSICQSLGELLDHYKKNVTNLQPTPKMVIYDSMMPWALNVARKYGLEGAPFFTQSCVVNAVYYHVYKYALKTPINELSLPCIGLLKDDDLPGFVSSPTVHPALLRLGLDQFSNLDEAFCMLVNTAEKLEVEAENWMSNECPVKTIGPTIPSMYLDKCLPDDKDYGLSLFKPETDACIHWLDAKETSSVVYISMGSLASLGEEQMEEIAKGLVKSNKYFLWVVRASEENKLPLNFKEETSGKGLIVSWCSQLEVLAHRAVGCFITHCGWNSTLEATSLGVPMVAIPQWSDQTTNAKYIVDFWKNGVRVKTNEEGLVSRDEIEFCIRDVMDGERGKEIKSNAAKWKQVAREAMEAGGSSERNIDEFVAKILCS